MDIAAGGFVGFKNMRLMGVKDDLERRGAR